MRKSRIVLAGVAVATAAAAGTAFTAANTLPTTSTVGYGTTEVTGINVSNVQYVPDTADHSLLSRVVFTTGDALNNKGASMSLRSGVDGSTIRSTVTCTVAAPSITCNAPANTKIAEFTTVGLAVFNLAPAA